MNQVNLVGRIEKAIIHSNSGYATVTLKVFNQFTQEQQISTYIDYNNIDYYTVCQPGDVVEVIGYYGNNSVVAVKVANTITANVIDPAGDYERAINNSFNRFFLISHSEHIIQQAISHHCKEHDVKTVVNDLIMELAKLNQNADSIIREKIMYFIDPTRFERFIYNNIFNFNGKNIRNNPVSYMRTCLVNCDTSVEKAKAAIRMVNSNDRPFKDYTLADITTITNVVM